MEPWRLFWAKTDRDGRLGRAPTWTHPLWAHLLDVANAALVLWVNYLPSSLKATLSAAIGLAHDEEQAGQMLSLFIGLHDTGKAIPSFQYGGDKAHPAVVAARERLAAEGLDFALFTGQGAYAHHGYATVPIVHRWLDARSLPKSTRSILFGITRFVGFHHGRVIGNAEVDRTGLEAIRGDPAWQHQQWAMLDAVVEAWGLPAWTAPALEDAPAWLVPFAGWATLADWIGSMAQHYPEDAHTCLDLKSYLPRSAAGAHAAFRATGLHRRAPISTTNAEHLFARDGRPFEPRPLQRAAAALPVPEAPSITILEAPTGEGKTEAALLRVALRGHAGAYVNLPTQATANGLYPRLRAFLERGLTPATDTSLTLLHGGAELNDAYRSTFEPESAEASPEPLDVADDPKSPTSEPLGDARAGAWFAQALKRGLLAPYGVGTVDQALLGVLGSRHFFLRLFALAGKTVVFDEVHAYDAYMTALFERLLGWLRVLGAHVVLLSATLPAATRERFLKAWDVQIPPSDHPDEQVPYPALWHGTPGHPVELEHEALKPTSWSQNARIERLAYDGRTRDSQMTEAAFAAKFDALAARVGDALGTGAVVGVVVNSVERAQRLFRLLDSVVPSNATAMLFHARFPAEDRAALETQVLSRFGRNPDTDAPRPPGPALLVATQVAEQSLDLDFDLLITDLAPLDLLLQRAGRLYRDLRTDAHSAPLIPRPLGPQPTVIVLHPQPGPDGDPDTSEVAYVYAALPVLRTWRVLRERNNWTLPHDYRPLVEAVYPREDALPEGALERWTTAQTEWRNAALDSGHESRGRSIGFPHEVLGLTTNPPSGHDDAAPLTRLSDANALAVCLHRVDHQLCLDADGKCPFPLHALRSLTNPTPDQKAARAEAVRLLQRRVVRIAAPQLAEAIELHPAPAAWTALVDRTPALYHHHLLVFEHHTCRVGPYALRLDPVLGLISRRA